MASNYTEHYQLNQWEAEDAVRRVDFNADNAKIDAALAGKASAAALNGLSSTVSSLNSRLSGKGNCTICLFSYTGNGKTGSDNPTVVSFPRRPALFLIFGDSIAIGRGGESNMSMVCSLKVTSGSAVYSQAVTWSGNSFSFYHLEDPQFQMNSNNIKYTVAAFYAEDGTA